MNKEELFKDWEDIVTDQLFNGDGERSMYQEIERNMWRISINEETAISLVSFLEKINGGVFYE